MGLTLNECAPSASPAYEAGDVQNVKAEPSIEHWNVSALLPPKPKRALDEFEGSAGWERKKAVAGAGAAVLPPPPPPQSGIAAIVVRALCLDCASTASTPTSRI